MFSTSELAAIKTAVTADATALAAWNAGSRGLLCQYMNSVPASAVQLTRTDVSQNELFHCLVPSDIASLAQWQQTVLQLASASSPIDFTNTDVASGLIAIFPSTTKTYANIMAIAQRPATWLEAVFTKSGVCSQYGAQIDVPTLIAAMEL